jgi:diacylglycerol diphosphate phosphatase / phosphatidate phosphatase
LSGICPTTAILFSEYLHGFGNIVNLVGTGSGLVVAITFGNAMADVAKVLIGRLRPDFISRCQWNGVQCSGIPRVIKEGRKSFPSGHATIVFAGMSYLIWYIAGRCRLFDRCASWRTKSIGIVGTILSSLMATAVAYSRIYDNWHYWSDVLVGAGLGVLNASCFYNRHFHWITSGYAGMSRWWVMTNHDTETPIYPFDMGPEWAV